MTDLIPAVLVYKEYGLPRALLRQLVAEGVIHCEVRIAPDTVNHMYLYSRSDIEKYLSPEEYEQ